LLVDSGNALFDTPQVTDDVRKAKARLILSAMSQMGTFAMAAGVRDLSAGAEFLASEARKENLKVLSVNLRRNGNQVFPSSAQVTVGDVKVGVIGVTAEGAIAGQAELLGEVALPLVLKEAQALSEKVDVVVLLAAMPYAQALKLGDAIEGQVDVMLQSHEARGQGAIQALRHVRMLPSGDRGRQVGSLLLMWQKKGQPFVDEAEQERAALAVSMLEAKLEVLRARLSKTRDAAARQALKMEIQKMEASQKGHTGVASSGKEAKNLMKLKWLRLGLELPEEPSLKAAIEGL
jgi:2',3'-cyclic-nucleotide 2'-phosphodiesterase (5'-nucleotidase family)